MIWRAFLKTYENFSGPKTFRGVFRMFFLGPEKCFSEHPKVSRNVSRYFRESIRAGKINQNRTALLLQLLFF